MKKFLNGTRNSLTLAVPAVAGLATTVTAFATDTAPTASAGFTITADMLSPIFDAVSANVGVILPIGISLFGVMIGISLIPKLFKKFTK